MRKPARVLIGNKVTREQVKSEEGRGEEGKKRSFFV
jgi:hypothetical protein